jgi:hypothetical protein
VRRLALVVVLAACKRPAPAVVVDGDWDEPAWQSAQREQFIPC